MDRENGRGDQVTYIAFIPKNLVRIVEGKKCCTSRVRRYGRVGDIVQTGAKHRKMHVDMWLKLTTQLRTTVEKVAKHLYAHEGCDSEEQFKTEWVDIRNEYRARRKYPPVSWDPKEEVWVHWFALKPMPRPLYRKLIVKGTTIQTTAQKTLEVIA